MLNYNEIVKKKYVVFNGEPHEVVDSHIFRKQQRKPVNQTKLRNLINGKVFDQTFQQSDKLEEAELEKKEIEFLFHKSTPSASEWWFAEPDDPSKRFQIDESIFADEKIFMKEGSVVEALVFQDEIIGINLPIKIKLEVTEAPPNIKGNTSSGGNKSVVLETGATVTTPLFIETGDVIEVNTETGDYVGRVTK